MTATFARRCGACGLTHLCHDVIRLCVCPCGGNGWIETVAATPEPRLVDLAAQRRLLRAAEVSRGT